MRTNLLRSRRARKYSGRYIAVSRNKIIASGQNAKEAYDLAVKMLGCKRIDGVFYVPEQKDFLIALCASSISH